MTKKNISNGILLFYILGILTCYAQDFGYDGSEGPTHWGDKYEKCVGKHQSPIDIDAKNVRFKDFPPLIYDNFDKHLEEVSVTNNGHTVMLSIDKGEIPTISGGPLNSTYGFSQLHFHWGPNDTLGSENKINHHSFPLELHIVMYNMAYSSFKQALNFKDGLTVLSFLYSVSHENNTRYNQFEQALDAVHNLLASKKFRDFVSLGDFVAIDRSAYFTYEGSLTTPPCSEVVTWIEFKNTIPVSKEQIRNFRLLYNKGGHLTHNYRPVQALHDRIIYYNRGISNHTSIMSTSWAIFAVFFGDRIISFFV
ncbi:hypothetical protein GWI33_018619 [Rhynchophorus ferrugineus]|uniref:Carbonic anhydrase n=1 Tax=Rhynchophorus ferrugineus TaxID=354439 RepID=A0A834M606_RHYFE|nr:hypothetical protein GWI33_018619 [Rhynchophorus ferrugineus]